MSRFLSFRFRAKQCELAPLGLNHMMKLHFYINFATFFGIKLLSHSKILEKLRNRLVHRNSNATSCMVWPHFAES